jgi:adenylate cyclase
MASFLKRLAKLQHAIIFLSITFLGLVSYAVGIPFMDLMELKALDLRFHSREPIQPQAEIVLAAIDEKSIAREGKWIWPRSKLADLVHQLSKAGARVIAFDIGFLEADNKHLVDTLTSIQREIRRIGQTAPDVETYLEKLKRQSDNDALLVEAIEASDVPVVLGFFFQMDSSIAPEIAEADMRRHQANIRQSKYNLELYASEAARRVPLPQPIYPQSNITDISNAARYAGYFNMIPDRDGVIRWLPSVYRFNDALYAPLSLVTASAYLDSQIAVHVDDFGVRNIQIGDITIPTDEGGRILINYRGAEKTFPYLSVTDILHERVPPGSIKDKIVMVGATAVGIFDLRVTPFGGVFPGLEIHANLVDSVLAEDFLQRPKWIALFDILAILLAGLLMGLALPRVPVIPGIALMIGIFLSYIFFCQFLFSRFGLVLNVIYPLAVLLLVYVGITAYRYFVETRQKRFIKNAFSTYLAPSVVKQLIDYPEQLILGGEERDITAFFSDVQGFTGISETLGPREIVELLNEFLTEMTNIILKHEGTVDKFEGDAIIAFFGAPNIQPDHAARALAASIEMQQRLVQLRTQWGAAGKPALKMRIGLCTGPAVVGNMGSQNRMDYTMMGDTVNIASRLEGLNKLYGVYTLVSESTVCAAGDGYLIREIDSVKVAGKKAPVTVYELIGRSGEAAEDIRGLIGHYARGLEAYRQRQWERAVDGFEAALGILPADGPSRTMLERCRRLKTSPPPDSWDGSYDVRTKF